MIMSNAGKILLGVIREIDTLSVYIAIDDFISYLNASKLDIYEGVGGDFTKEITLLNKLIGVLERRRDNFKLA